MKSLYTPNISNSKTWSTSMQHRLILTLGTNTGSSLPLDIALSELKQSIVPLGVSPTMQTKPIDFPYPSRPFHNIILVGITSLCYEALCHECKRIEVLSGRTLEQREVSPELIPLDLDIVIWDGKVCKPKDLYRPYVFEGLREIFLLD
ncbi:MAG: 2-amino-4-hydroxy-6-hydroxymethyldihydropteridine diphosphokinase [Porphyromonadaceae bacterium]|nr:2-amino-4-hydroxy-6-hydroxymethyldihydropteridine diphosphokinase [Porphyromonadaceae bacterium]